MSAILAFFLKVSTDLKLYHWMTGSYARHKASDDLVSRISELGDRFVETYIGRYGRPSMAKRDSNIAIAELSDTNVVAYVDHAIKFLLHDVTKMLKKEDVDLLNIRDELIGAFNQTKYLFTLA